MSPRPVSSNPRPLSETQPEYEEAEAALPADQQMLDRALEAEQQAQSNTDAARKLSLAATAEKEKDEAKAFSDALQNPCVDWQSLSELTVKPELKIHFLDRFAQRAIEIELPRLHLATLRAKAAVLKREHTLAQLRVEIGEAKFQQDLGSLTSLYGPVLASSDLIEALRRDASQASAAWLRAVDAVKEELARQQRRAQQLASVGIITSRQVGF